MNQKLGSQIYLVVPAGGKGTRMGTEVPKQFLDWGGLPLINVTINAFFTPDMPKIAGIAIALPPDRLEEAERWEFPVQHWCTAGGETRQNSVAAAFKLLPGKPDDIVLIHDAVRPFPPATPINEAIRALENWDGAVLAEASTDTLKRVDVDLQIIATEPREFIYRAQTPQVAKLATWKKALAWANDNTYNSTDDVSILEAMGLRIKVIPSPSSNQKITVPEDWGRMYGRRTFG